MKKILLVDDSATARMFLRRCFEIAGLSDAQYLEAASAEAVSYTHLTLPTIYSV